MLNKDVLDNVFDIDTNIKEQDVNELVVREEKTDRKKPDDIIYDNINKANQLLDTILNNVSQQVNENGQLNARLMEVAGQLIDKITSAATSITSADIDYADIQLKQQNLLTKQKELDWKINKDGTISTRSNSPERQVIITDRESILQMMRNKELE
jgi:hypothetical protein